MNVFKTRWFSSIFLSTSLIGMCFLGQTSSSSVDNTPIKSPWSKFETPIAGAPMSIGKYDGGCLIGSEKLYDGLGYTVMHRERQRFYGHPDTLQFIHELAQYALENENVNLMIGDVAMIRGGPTLTQHHSHQTGLDVDIWFKLSPSGKPYPHIPEYSSEDLEKYPELKLEEENALQRRVDEGADLDLDSPELVNWHLLDAKFKRTPRKLRKRAYSDTKLLLSAISPGWTAVQERIVLEAARNPRVERIFIDPVLKKKFCVTYPNETEILKKLRPTWAHDDHFHVRLSCPTNDTQCVKQKESVTVGCSDKDFLPFLRRIVFSTPPHKEPMPRLPRECRQVFLAK